VLEIEVPKTMALLSQRRTSFKICCTHWSLYAGNGTAAGEEDVYKLEEGDAAALSTVVNSSLVVDPRLSEITIL